MPFIFKRAIDTLTSGSTSAAVGWMLAYGMSRGVYTLLQELPPLTRYTLRCILSCAIRCDASSHCIFSYTALHRLTVHCERPSRSPLTTLQELRYLTFTPVGQNALRRFMADAFAHVQSLDAAWLTQQSTGELSRVFARGVRGMSALLRLLLFNLLPTFLEATLVMSILGRRYGQAYFWTAFMTVASFVALTLTVVQRRVALLTAINEADNRIFTRFFNAMINNEAVRSFTNEPHDSTPKVPWLARSRSCARRLPACSGLPSGPLGSALAARVPKRVCGGASVPAICRRFHWASDRAGTRSSSTTASSGRPSGSA